MPETLPKPEKEPVKFKKEFREPWKELRQERAESYYSQYRKEKGLDQFDLKKEELNLAATILERQYSLTIEKIAKDWFLRHKNEIQAKGQYLDWQNPDYIVKLFFQNDGLKELEILKDSKSEAFKATLEQLELAMEEIKSGDKLSVAVMLEFLHVAQKQMENLKEEAAKLTTQPPSQEKDLKLSNNLNQQKELLLIKKRFYESLRGVNVESEVLPQVLQNIGPQEQYINNNLYTKSAEILTQKIATLFSQKWNELPPEKKAEFPNLNHFINSQSSKLIKALNDFGLPRGVRAEVAAIALLEQGYDATKFTQERSFWQKIQGVFGIKTEPKINMGFGTALSFEDYYIKITSITNQYTAQIEQETKEALKNDWEQLKKNETDRLVSQEIDKLSQSVEKNLKNIYEDLRKVALKRAMEAIKDAELKRNKGKKEQIEKTEEVFEEKEVDTAEFMKNVLYREGPLKKLTGDLEYDSQLLREFFQSYGLDIDEGDIVSLSEQLKKGYIKEVKKQKGFLSWIFEAVASMFKE